MSKITAKCIGVRYPRVGGSVGKNSGVMDLIEKNDIKSIITKLLFQDGYDYVVINYNNGLHICEKDTETTYSRRICLYHPYMTMLEIPQK